MVWDTTANHKFSAATHQSAVDIDLFEGMTVVGAPLMTIVNGQIVFNQGKIVPNASFGHFVARKPFGTPYARKVSKK